MPSNKTSVGIIGAGISGLAAARRLIEQGVNDVIILETNSRIGGRIKSVQIDDKNGMEDVVELGAQWIHGEQGNVALDIAKELDLIDDPDGATLEEIGEDFFVDDGSRWGDEDEEQVEQLWDIYEYAEEHGSEYEGHPNESLGDYFSNEVFKKAKKRYPGLGEKLDLFHDYFHRYMQSLDGVDDWNEASFKGSLVLYEALEGNEMVTFKVERQTKDLLDYFLDKIPLEKIMLNSTVDNIMKNGDGSLTVAVNNGSKLYNFDRVIVTCSLGVLKERGKRMFTPTLSQKKQLAIEEIGIGVVDKLFLKFDEPWWPAEDFEGFAFLFRREADYSNPDTPWTRSLLGAYSIMHKPNLLGLWIAGAGARKMEQLSDDEIRDDLMAFLRKMLGEEYPNIPDPVGFRTSRWHSERDFRGSYSYLPVEAEMAGVSASTLAEPEWDGSLLFAGEATHKRFFSTMHGAIETGWREADRIINNPANTRS